MDPMEVNLFASRLTRQLPRFYSWRPDPEAEATDAFMQNWAACWGFTNPLVSDALLPCQSEKATNEDSTNNIRLENPIVALKLLEDYSQRIPQQPDLVSIPLGQDILMQQGGCVPILFIMRNFCTSFRPHAYIVEGQNQLQLWFLIRVETNI